MTKFIDIFLIGALAINLFNIYRNYSATTEILGAEIPTWVAVLVQVVCILLLAFKLYKNRAASK